MGAGDDLSERGPLAAADRPAILGAGHAGVPQLRAEVVWFAVEDFDRRLVRGAVRPGAAARALRAAAEPYPRGAGVASTKGVL